VLHMDGGLLLVARSMCSANLLDIDIGDLSLITVEDLGKFLESWATGFNVEEVDEAELESDPDL
jgi:hypothetical protein